MRSSRPSRAVVLLASLLFGAGAGVGLAHAEKVAPAPVDGGARVVESDGGISKTPPDPSPMRERTQWIFDLRYDKNDLFLLGVHRLELPQAQETQRAIGRFALELFEGPTLIERVRFDFPLLGDGPLSSRGDAGSRPVPDFTKKLVTRIGVMFPATSRGTKMQLWDRATDRRWDLPWPPTDTRGVDAGG